MYLSESFTHTLGESRLDRSAYWHLKRADVWPFWWFSKAVGLKFHTIQAKLMIPTRAHSVPISFGCLSTAFFSILKFVHSVSRKLRLSSPNFSSFIFPKRSAKPEWNQQWRWIDASQLKESRSGTLFLLPLGFELHQSEKPCCFSICKLRSSRLQAVKRSHFLVW